MNVQMIENSNVLHRLSFYLGSLENKYKILICISISLFSIISILHLMSAFAFIMCKEVTLWRRSTRYCVVEHLNLQKPSTCVPVPRKHVFF